MSRNLATRRRGRTVFSSSKMISMGDVLAYDERQVKCSDFQFRNERTDSYGIIIAGWLYPNPGVCAYDNTTTFGLCMPTLMMEILDRLSNVLCRQLT